jgi:hypothetical protein
MSHIDHLNIDLSPLQLENNRLTDELRLSKDNERILTEDLIHTRRERDDASEACDMLRQRLNQQETTRSTSIAIGDDGRHERKRTNRGWS